MLPFKSPKSELQIKDNITHLQKQKRQTSKLIEDHKDKADYAKLLHTKIYPTWHRMGYTVNKDIDLRDAKRDEKHHLKQLGLHQKNLESLNQNIAKHKQMLKTVNTPTVKPKVKKAIPTTPMQMAAADWRNRIANRIEPAVNNPSSQPDHKSEIEKKLLQHKEATDQQQQKVAKSLKLSKGQKDTATVDTSNFLSKKSQYHRKMASYHINQAIKHKNSAPWEVQNYHINEYQKHTGNSGSSNQIKKPLQLTSPSYNKITAAFKIKDNRYYERLGKLMHLAIDKDAQDSIRGSNDSTKVRAANYKAAYEGHKYYNKMNDYFKKAAAHMPKPMEATASHSNHDLNLMQDIYMECVANLAKNSITASHPNYDTLLMREMQKHPDTVKLQHLQVTED